MCGLAGVFAPENKVAHRHLTDMADAIMQRGPDSVGYWISEHQHIGLAHRRLAILDLSAAGHQPMLSSTGRYMLAYNGEIYNHLTIRAELEAISARTWRGHSDTETLLAAIEQWGLTQSLQKITGMFALALWDNDLQCLQLARDRFGEKPLYYGWQQGVFLFGSQLNALRAHPAFTPTINRSALTLLLRYNYIPVPFSIYEGIHKLKPGTILLLDRNQQQSTVEYWSVKTAIYNAKTLQNNSTDQELIAELECTLKQAVAKQMMADVPLGAFLSGGVDSSLIVALMQAQSDRPVKTFSIGFNDKRFNEAEFAKAVAEHLGTDHTELYVSAEDALAVVPKLADIYDEPFADSSQIPTYLVSKMAKQHVTVSLSGDAGDELFCGYNRYIYTQKLWRKISRVPIVIRKIIAKLLTSLPVNLWDNLAKYLPSNWRLNNLGAKLHKAAGVLSAEDARHLYIGLVSTWQKPEDVVLLANEPITALTDPQNEVSLSDPILQMMAQDSLSYLPDDILVKVDRAAMAVSLETRVPFLDHRVFEHAWRLPLSIKLKQGTSKWCLRQILYKYVPQSLIERPKMGFSVPLDAWLRGPLQTWAESLLAEERLVQEGFFNAKLVRTMWQEHLSGKRNWQYQLWSILMFQAWYERYH